MSEPVLDWTADIPDGWEVLPLKRVAEIANSNVDKKSYDDGIPVRLCNYTDVYYNEYITPDLPFMDATATASEIRRFRLRPGDVIITKDSESWNDIAIPACVRADIADLVCGYHLTVLRPRPQLLDGRFLLRALQATGVREQFWVSANGVTRFGLGLNGIGMTRVPQPPLAKQRAIADFLDRKTAAIDTLIEKKERLVALLEEKRQALITQAVTKGLDPSVPMKASGIEWLGEIPAHWQVRRIGHLAGVVRGASPRPAGDPAYFGGEHTPWITVGEVTKDEAKYLTATAERLTEAGRSLSRVVQPGTLLLTNSGVTLGVPKITQIEGCINDGSVALVKVDGQRCQQDFLYWFLKSQTRNLREGVRQGQGQPNLNTDIVRSIRVSLPPIVEQKMIVEGIERTDRTALASAVQLEESLRLLREYRQAVITAAVTGKLDIPSEAA